MCFFLAADEDEEISGGGAVEVTQMVKSPSLPMLALLHDDAIAIAIAIAIDINYELIEVPSIIHLPWQEIACTYGITFFPPNRGVHFYLNLLNLLLAKSRSPFLFELSSRQIEESISISTDDGDRRTAATDDGRHAPTDRRPSTMMHHDEIERDRE